MPRASKRAGAVCQGSTGSRQVIVVGRATPPSPTVAVPAAAFVVGMEMFVINVNVRDVADRIAAWGDTG